MVMTVTTEQVMSLRNQTGAGLMDCKQALKDANGDMAKAIEILRKKGLAGLAKRAGREMKEGIVAFKSESNKYALIEINCETDFVAKNPEVSKLANEILDLMLKDPSYANPAGNEKAKEKLQNLAMKTGENMQIRRGVVYNLENTVAGVYVHSDNKKAAIVELSFEGNLAEKLSELQSLARDIAMQCVDMNPRWIRKSDVPAEVIEKEKEIYKENPQAKGKSEIALAKMLEGRIKKFYEETCLVEQPYIRNQKINIEGLLKDKSLQLGGKIDIKRFDCYIVGVE